MGGVHGSDRGCEQRGVRMNNRGNGVSRAIYEASEGKYFSVRNRAKEKGRLSSKGKTRKGKTKKERRKGARKGWCGMTSEKNGERL